MKKSTLKNQARFYVWFKVLCLLILSGWSWGAKGQCIIGTGTLTTNGSTADPIERYYNYEHFQMVYTAAELAAGGMSAGSQITAMGFSVSESAVSLANFTISMGLTTNANAATYISSGLTVVKPAFTYTPVVQTAGNFDMITLTTPFTWDGTSNIVVNTCTGSNPFTSPYGGLRYTTGATVGYTRTDATSNCGNTTSASTTTTRPNIRFNFSAGTPCSGTPTAGTLPTSLSACSLNTATSISITGATSATGISYQWQESNDNITFINAVGGSGATSSTYTTPANLTATKYYRCIVTCTNSSISVNTNSCTVNIIYCTYDVTYSSGATWTSIMPANGGSGNVYSGWQSTTSGDDNTTTTQSLAGTTFKYQGNPVTGFQACTNGWMTFNTANTSVAYSNGLTASSPNLVLAPFWDDLVLTGQAYANRDACMRYQVIGTLGSGSAIIVIEWAGLERFSIAGPNLNFQVRLYEGSNNIEFVYGNFEGFDGTVTSAYSYSLGYNGTNPAGTTSTDRFAMQTAVTNHFSATSDPATHQVMPACFSKFTFTPGTYTGPTSAPVIPAPSNDNVANATTLSVNSSPCTAFCGTYYTSLNATNSGFGPSTCGTTAGYEDDDVWFKFNTTVATDYTIKLRNSPGYDGVLQLLDASYNSITCVNATGAGLIETINAIGLIAGGQTYYLRVYHNGTGVGGSGQFSMCVSEVINPPSNDNICGATNLTTSIACSATNSQMPSTLAATASPQAACSGTPDDDVWYKFTAVTASDLVTVQSGAGYNAQLQIFSSSDNTCTGTLTSLACVNNTSTGGVETFSGTLTPGNTYFARVYHTATGAGSGNFSICVTAVAPSCITSPTSPADGGSSGACAANAVTLSWPSASVATGYDVYVDGSLVSTNQAALTYNAGVLSAGTHTWKIVARNGIGSASGCPTWSFSVTPLVCSAATLSSGARCAGSNFTATANTTGGGAPFTYVWNDGVGGVYPNASSVTVNLAAGSYTLTCSISDACSSVCSSSVTVAINALPSVTLSSSSSVNCLPGSGVTLTAGGALTYSYTPSASLTPATGSPVNANPSATTSYTVAGTDLNGCMNTASKTISIGATVTMNSVTASPNTFCHVGTSTLTASASIAASITYCIPVTTCSYPDIITNVTFGGINRTSTCDALTASGFSYFNSAPNVGSVTAGTTYPINVSTGGDIEGAAVWIDYDQNGTFDASELVLNGLQGTNPATYSGIVNIPATAYNGTTRMRVRCTYNVDPVTTLGPCANATYGETEDYDIVISGGVNPVSPLTYAWSQSGSSTLGGSTSNIESATNITANTTYTVVATSAAGCSASGSVSVTNAATTSSINVTSPTSCYTWPVTGISYGANGIYTGTIANAAGCDSIITMHLTVTPGISLRAKAILAGCYDSSNGLMWDSLRVNGLIPTVEPYSYPPYGKPFIGVPNGETVSPAVLAVTGNNAIVDWVYLELRDAITPATIVATKRALIQRDGDIVSDVDGMSPVFFTGLASGAYNLSIKHRNHLGVMTATPVVLGPCANGVIDFTTMAVWVKAGEVNGPRKMFGSVGALWAADANRNKNSKYNGLSNDKQEVLNTVGVGTPNNVISIVYRSEDLNLDASVKYNGLDNDRNVIANTVNVATPNNIVNQHTPN